MVWKEQFTKWKKFSKLEKQLRKELEQIEGNEELIREYFHEYVPFGTGGMRAKMGVGTNQMNIYTVRGAAYGLGQLVVSYGKEEMEKGIVVAYDSRNNSQLFATEAARTLGTLGIKVYLFSDLAPTPFLSYAVRYFKASGGIVITASHNPAIYNGFKVYGPDGAQCSLERTEKIIAEMEKISDELLIPVKQLKELELYKFINYIEYEFIEEYIDSLAKLSNHSNTLRTLDEFKVVYTPLHGSGLNPVMRALKLFGVPSIVTVPEQMDPDGDFPSVKVPNPEEYDAFKVAMKIGKSISADILMATDPDADRLGVAIRNGRGVYELLTGNQIGVLLLEYCLAEREQRGDLPVNGVVLSSIVTSEMGRKIAENYGCTLEQTLTGFKFIGEKINEYEKSGEKTFVFGYEESNGYLIDPFVREKDAVQAAALFAEMAGVSWAKGVSVYEVLKSLYEKYGYYKESLESITVTGIEGSAKIKKMMTYLREERIKEIGAIKIIVFEDYDCSIRYEGETESCLTLPQSDVLKFYLADESWICIRPSGTEPKVKFYFGVKEQNEVDAQEKLKTLQATTMTKIKEVLSRCD